MGLVQIVGPLQIAVITDIVATESTAITGGQVNEVNDLLKVPGIKPSLIVKAASFSQQKSSTATKLPSAVEKISLHALTQSS